MLSGGYLCFVSLMYEQPLALYWFWFALCNLNLYFLTPDRYPEY